VIFFLSFSLVYKYVRKTVVQHKTIKRIKFVVRKQSGFFNTFSLKLIVSNLICGVLFFSAVFIIGRVGLGHLGSFDSGLQHNGDSVVALVVDTSVEPG
jgi:hypothetical protein